MINSFETFIINEIIILDAVLLTFGQRDQRGHICEKQQTDFSENSSKKSMGITFPGEYHFLKFISCLSNADFFFHLTISAINDLRKYKLRFFLIPFYCVIPDAFLDFILFILLSIILSIQ